MSFLDKVKYINMLSVVDEFGGRGNADKITRFYIAFRVSDENSCDIEVTKAEIEEAILDKNIVITDYTESREYTLGVLKNNAAKCDFVMASKIYKNNVNLIGINTGGFNDTASICVSFRKDDGSVIASTSYLSDFPSTFFLNGKLTEK